MPGKAGFSGCYIIFIFTFTPRYGVSSSSNPARSDGIGSKLAVWGLWWEGPRVEGTCSEVSGLSSCAGAGAARGGEGGDDPTTSVPVHTAAARDRHVQPKCEFPAPGPRPAEPQGDPRPGREPPATVPWQTKWSLKWMCPEDGQRQVLGPTGNLLGCTCRLSWMPMWTHLKCIK